MPLLMNSNRTMQNNDREEVRTMEFVAINYIEGSPSEIMDFSTYKLSKRRLLT